jgi:hypothetical protein
MRNWDPQLSESPPGDRPSSIVPSLAYPASGSPSTSALPSVCEWEKDWRDVQAVARHVGIPENNVRLVDFTKEYWSRVFEPSVAAWEAGATPNPDVMCNKSAILYLPVPMGLIQSGRSNLVRCLTKSRINRGIFLQQVSHTWSCLS